MRHKFEIKSGKIHVTDPCYEVDTCDGYNIPAKNGTWEVQVREVDSRVAEFTAYHLDHEPSSVDDLIFDPSLDCGVDSGQFGIFDAEGYKGDTDDDDRKWYYDICRVTCPWWDDEDWRKHKDDPTYGVTPDGTGFVSSSGYGDGGYSGYFLRDEDGNVVAFRVVFIGDDEEEEEE
jgi:hypothetical protein